MQSTQVKGLHWRLERVKELAEARKIHVHKTRGVEFFATASEAFETARETLLQLQERQFAETQKLTWDVADVYGVKIAGAGWYLKICIDEAQPEVVVISFHPLERPLKTRGGVVKP